MQRTLIKERKMKKTKRQNKRKHSDAYYDFFYAFWITMIIDGAAVVFMLSGMK